MLTRNVTSDVLMIKVRNFVSPLSTASRKLTGGVLVGQGESSQSHVLNIRRQAHPRSGS